MKRILLLALLSIGIGTAYSQSTPETKTSYTVSGGLVGALNLTDFRVTGSNSNGIDYDSKAGWSFGAWLNFPLGSSFSLEPQVMYSTYNYRTNNTTPGLLLYDGDLHYVSIPLLLKFHPGEKFALSVGPQVDLLTGVDDDNNTAVKSDFNKSSWSLSAGVEVFPHGVVTPFARYIHGMSNMDNRIGHSSAQEYKNQNIQIGLKVKLFGKKKETYQAAPTAVVEIPDSDGDGIKDDVDKCPNQPGLAKYNGCPIPDSDGDGINDEEDKCPNQAGLAKYNGCPIPDSDGDGINDEEDKCPNQAGVAKYDGCPVPDRDGDGINDENDKCPDLAGVAANNGCPEVPANVSKTLGVSASKIKFGTTSTTTTTITNGSYSSLDQVVTAMNENPGLMIKVEGHTDNAGDDEKNMQLSTDRANAVKDYLVSKGISADRITAEGFGETTPIADNNTAAGRAKNRRIEIRMTN